ncbi:hypothetical protein IFR05_012205 [Cadophora sp. M221]|nr:hypothetical protein IFR05_012205 [Cadophora sp. M221]
MKTFRLFAATLQLTVAPIIQINSGDGEPYGVVIKKSTIPEIQEHVTKDFFAEFPDAITFGEIKTDFRSKKNQQSKWGKYNEVDVQMPAPVNHECCGGRNPKSTQQEGSM